MRFGVSVVVVLLMFSFAFVFADYSLDIGDLKTESYSVGDELIFTPILLEDENKVSENIEIVIYDIQETKNIERLVMSNEEQSFSLEEDFPSGLWIIKAVFNNESVERTFTIQEKTEVEFSIVGNELIIKNTGNTRYQKTIQITIGEIKQSKTLNIPVNGQREWQLVAPKGLYDIEITDGETTVSKRNIQLLGTGNVIGAIDENLVGYSGFGTVPSAGNIEDRFISLNKIPLTIVFLVVIFGLGILIGVERYTKRRKVEVEVGL